MKRLFIYLLSISVLAALTCAGIFYANPVYPIENDYFHIISAKTKRLKNLKSPKIILVGGSNLAFGIDSKQISDSLNMPVVNMGIGAAFGLEFEINQVSDQIKSGDIVIISEYPAEPNYEAIFTTYTSCPETKLGIKSASQYYRLFKAGMLTSIQSIQNTIFNFKDFNPKYNHGQSINDTTSVYFQAGFNEFGDLISHLNNPKPGTLNDRGSFGGNFLHHIQLMNDFKNIADSANVRLYYINPPYPVSEYKRNFYEYNRYQQVLRKNLKLPMLGNEKDNIYPDRIFFDTIYHLDSVGRSERTERLIHELSRKLRGPKQ